MITVGVLAGAFGASGCGSSGPSGDPAAAFAGNWTFDSGSIMPMCTGVNVAAVDLTGAGVMLSRVDSTHVRLVATTGITCDVRFSVSGSTATVASGQSCAISVMGTPATINITSWTLALSGDTIASTMAGTANVVVVSCTPTSTGTLSRPPTG
jgi:hypothetical protein